ncbi:MAG: hypothetical protein JO228_15320 [Xanthobacteraceae bacterium]|nr:hypothetical protein [Xanthobacteraceae bacterium]
MQSAACPVCRAGGSPEADDVQSPGTTLPDAVRAAKLASTACSAMA